MVRINVSQGNGVTTHGSGALIDQNSQYGWILTCEHIFHGRKACEIAFPSGKKLAGVVVEQDSGDDVAIVRIPRPNTPPFNIASTEPVLGQRLVVAGYGMGNYRTDHGSVSSTENGILALGGHKIEQGDSGGPIYISNGGIVSVLAMYQYPEGQPSRREFGGLGLARLKRFIARCGCPSYQKAVKRPPVLPPPVSPQPDPTQFDIRIGQVTTVDSNSSASALLRKEDSIYYLDLTIPRGKPGTQGLRGLPGLAGQPGQAAQIKLEELVKAVIKNLPPIYPQWIDNEGNVTDEIPGGVRLGQTMPLRLEAALKNARAQSK